MPHLPYPSLRDLDFGRLDAREESRVSPDLLLGGYYDFQQAAYRIASGNAWVVVGPKGAGKSAALEHLGLMWDANPEKFLQRWELGSFPVSDVTSIRVGSAPGPTSTRAAWEFLELLKIFESLMSDQGISHPAEVLNLKRDLVAAGLIEGPDLKTKFLDWSSSTVKFNVAGFGVEGQVAESGATALQVTELVRRAIRMISTESQHVLAIDGLDSFFAQSDKQLESLAALLDATSEVNAFLSDASLRATVVLAIRSDMFAQVPSTDSAKLGDHAVELDWSRGGVGDGNELWDLVSSKARASVPRSFAGQALGDVRRAYLQNPIWIGGYDSIPRYFLSHTRLLPRDLIALMTELKALHGRSGPVPESTAKEAVRRYCETYFVREMTNGLSRVLPGESATKVAVFTEALSTLPNREFNAAALKAETEGVLDQGDLRALLRQLFTVGGLGVRTRSNGTMHTNFIYRRTAGGGFSFVADYVLHSSLVVAWNLQW